MHDDPILPDDDPDRLLARRLGARLDVGYAPETAAEDKADGGDGALLSLLAAHRDAAAESPAPEASARMWATVEAGMRAEATRQGLLRLTVLRALFSARRIGYLAAVVVMAGLAWMLLLHTPAPVLVAEAGNEVLQHTLADGSVVTLRPHSALYALAAADEARRFRLDGEAFFDVTHDPARAFSVEGGEARVSVLGTRFGLQTWGGAAAVFLEEGRVEFAHLRTAATVVLAPGQASRVTAQGRLAPPATASADAALDWMRGELVFDQTSIRRILDELGHHYALTFDVPAALLDETLSGRVLLGTRTQALADLGAALGGRFVTAADGTARLVME